MTRNTWHNFIFSRPIFACKVCNFALLCYFGAVLRLRLHGCWRGAIVQEFKCYIIICDMHCMCMNKYASLCSIDCVTICANGQINGSQCAIRLFGSFLRLCFWAAHTFALVCHAVQVNCIALRNICGVVIVDLKRKFNVCLTHVYAV